MRPARFGSETPSHASKRSGHAPLEFGATIAVVDKEMSIAEREINIFSGLVICRDRRLPGHLGPDAETADVDIAQNRPSVGQGRIDPERDDGIYEGLLGCEADPR